jgi:hypothetical protein
VDILGEIFRRSRERHMAKGFLFCILILALGLIAWIFYKTTLIRCGCHLKCRGKYCNCDFDKEISNEDEEKNHEEVTSFKEQK